MENALFHLCGGSCNEHHNMKTFHVAFNDYKLAVAAWNENVNMWPDLTLHDHEGIIIRQLSMFQK